MATLNLTVEPTSVKQGGTYTATATLTGGTPNVPNINLALKGRAVGDATWTTISAQTVGTDATGFAQATFTIPVSATQTPGTYELVVTLTVDTVTGDSNIVTVYVYSFTLVVSPTSVPQGGTCTATVTLAGGVPNTPNINLELKGRELGGDWVTISTQTVSADATGGFQSIFTIPVPSTQTPGTYELMVTGTTAYTTADTNIVAITVTTAVTDGYVTVNAYQDSTAIAAAVTLDGQSGTTPHTFTVPAGTYSITATYQEQTLPAQTVTIVAGQIVTVNLLFPMPVQTITLNVVAGTGGSVSPSGQLTLTIGEAYQFTETEDIGHNFDHWDLAGTNKGSSPSLILTIMSEMDEQTLTALFITEPPPQITMTLAVAGMGTTDIAPGTHTFNVGDLVEFTAIPNAGQTFIRWTLDGTTYTDNPLPLTITEGMNGKTLTAQFTGPTPSILPGLSLIAVASLFLIPRR